MFLEVLLKGIYRKNLSFYSSGVSYEVNGFYSVAEDYAVAILDVSGVTYRALLKYDGAWSVVDYPRMVLSYDDFPEVPESIIRDANMIGR